jgi:hypothetical protein
MVTKSTLYNNSTYYLNRSSIISDLENTRFSLLSFTSFLKDSLLSDLSLNDNFIGNFLVNQSQDFLFSFQSIFTTFSNLFKETTKSLLSLTQSFFTTNEVIAQNSIHTSKSLAIESSFSHNLNGSHELPSDYRFQKTQHPIFKYDFKVGNYMTEAVVKLNRHFFTTVNDTTTGLRVAP